MKIVSFLAALLLPIAAGAAPDDPWQRVGNTGFTSVEGFDAEETCERAHPGADCSNPGTGPVGPSTRHMEDSNYGLPGGLNYELPWTLSEYAVGQTPQGRTKNVEGGSALGMSGFSELHMLGPDGVFTPNQESVDGAIRADGSQFPPPGLTQGTWEQPMASDYGGLLRTPTCSGGALAPKDGTFMTWDSQNVSESSNKFSAIGSHFLYRIPPFTGVSFGREFRNRGLGFGIFGANQWSGSSVVTGIDEPGTDAVQLIFNANRDTVSGGSPGTSGGERHVHVEVWSCDGVSEGGNAEVLYVEDFFTGDGSTLDCTAAAETCTVTVKKKTPGASDISGFGVWSIDGAFFAFVGGYIGNSTQTTFTAREDHSDPYGKTMIERFHDRDPTIHTCFPGGGPIQCFGDTAHRVCNGGTIYANHCGDGTTPRHPDYPIASAEAWNCQLHPTPESCPWEDRNFNGKIDWVEMDFNGDGLILASDFSGGGPGDDTFLECFAANSTSGACAPADANNDGFISTSGPTSDFQQFLRLFELGEVPAAELDGMAEAGLVYPY